MKIFGMGIIELIVLIVVIVVVVSLVKSRKNNVGNAGNVTRNSTGGSTSGVYREYTIIMLIAWAIPVFIIVCPFVLMSGGQMGQNTVAFGLILAFILLLADLFIVVRLARNVISRHEIINIDPLRQNEVNQAIHRVMSNDNWVAAQGPEQYNFVKQSRLATMPTISIGMMPSGQNIQVDIYISGGSVGKYGDLRRPIPALKMKDALLDALAPYQPGVYVSPNQQGTSGNSPSSNQPTSYSQLSSSSQVSSQNAGYNQSSNTGQPSNASQNNNSATSQNYASMQEMIKNFENKQGQ